MNSFPIRVGVLSALISFLLIGCNQTSNQNSATKSEDTQKTEITADVDRATTNHEKSWFFVLNASSMKVLPPDSGSSKFRLEILNYNNTVTGFTDRPDREYSKMPGKKFFSEWDNVFNESYPNASIIHDDNGLHNNDINIVTLEKVLAIDDSRVILEMSYVEKDNKLEVNKTYSGINIFIDSISDCKRYILICNYNNASNYCNYDSDGDTVDEPHSACECKDHFGC